jgi:hypothetical protein
MIQLPLIVGFAKKERALNEISSVTHNESFREYQEIEWLMSCL